MSGKRAQTAFIMNQTLTGVMVSFDYYPEHDTASRVAPKRRKAWPKKKAKVHYFKIKIQA